MSVKSLRAEELLPRALAAAVRVDEVKDIRDKSIAMEVYAYQARDAELAASAVELKRRATRRLGELIDEQRKAGKLAKGTRGQGRPKKGGLRKNPPKSTPTLASQSIDKNLADQARKLGDFGLAMAGQKKFLEFCVIQRGGPHRSTPPRDCIFHPPGLGVRHTPLLRGVPAPRKLTLREWPFG